MAAHLSPEDLDRLRAARAGADPAESLFDPTSVTWRVNREAAILLGGNLAGRVVGQTGLGGFGAIVVLPPAMARLHGRRAAFVAAGVAVPMLLKRITGNRPPAGPRGRAYLTRLVLDRDPGDMQTTT